MRKYIIPASLFASVFLTGLIFASHIFIHIGQQSLFLLTPDYFAQVFREPFPITHIVVSFFTQFFDIPAVGPLVAAAVVLAIYFLFCAIFHEWSMRGKLYCALVPILAACCFVAASPTVRRADRHYAIEQYARQHQWDRILKIAPFTVAEKDRTVIPYAMLALNAKGQLMEKMDAYPLKGPQDLDMEGSLTREAYWFSSILDECLGNYNEAIHHLFQASCTMPYGMSHITLYQLIRFNIENENYTLARKYARILRRNPRNSVMAGRILKSLEGKHDRAESPDTAASAPVVTDSPMYNLAMLRQAGIHSAMANERLAAYIKLAE